MGLRDDRSWWLPEAGPVELADLTVAGLLAAAAADSANRDAVIVSAYPDLGLNVRWTYRDLHERARRLARALIGAGVAAGDRVALWAPNVPDWLVTEFAVAMAGAVLVPVNPTYRRDELRH
nr:AMP-binding protein [Actinomycetota bacterium]